MRRWWMLLVPVALVAGCSNDSTEHGGSGSVANSSPSVQETTTPTLGTLDNVFAGADVDALCAEANRAAAAAADQVGSSGELTAPEQLLYFQLRSGVVDILTASLQSLQGDQGIDIPAAVDALGAYNAWVQAQVTSIQQSGATVTEDDGGALDAARSALGGTGACGDLFVMN